MRAGEGDGKRMFWVEKNQKINYWGGARASIRHSRVGTKFILKITLLNFWIKLAQKGCFRTKENENCHRILHI